MEEAREHVRDAGSLAEGDVDGLTRAVLEAVEDVTWREAAGGRARALAEGKYSVARATAEYVRALEEGLGPGVS